jgi:shikimate dehydrogenase
MLLALGELGCWVAQLLVRDPERAADTIDRVTHNEGPLVLTGSLEGDPIEADIVVSTVPAEAQTPDLLTRLAHVPVVFDVVYDPWPTPLAESAADRTLVGGLDLLVHQAALQVGLMTGLRDVPLAAMRAAGERGLAERAPG